MTAIQSSSKNDIMSSEAVKAKTGQGWDEWFALLDEAGCAKMSHKEIVAVCHDNGVGSWWQQMVTVQYERARGLRVLHQSCDGEFRASASKTLNVPIEVAFQFWNDSDKRDEWLPGAGLTIRKATSPKSLRISWKDGTNLDVGLYPKGEGKCSCAIEHGKLSGPEEVRERKQFWSAAMERLKQSVERDS